MSTAETMGEAQSTALAPITDALPELRAEVYADVCAWDAARLDLRVGYDAADGEYLAKIQEKLAPASLWHSYLTARHIAPRTAYDRIAKAQGRYVESASKHSNHTVAPGADARRLEETAASLRAAQAREAEARERATRAEEEQVRLNHQLAVAHEAVKRLKGHPSPPSLPSLPSWWPTETTDWVQWGERAEEEAREQAEKRAGRAAHAKPLTPKEQERRGGRATGGGSKRGRAEGGKRSEGGP